MKLFKITVENDIKERVDSFLTNKVNEIEEYKGFFSRTKIKNIIKNQLLQRNNEILDDPSFMIKQNDEYVIILDDVKDVELEAKNIDIDIVYEDKDLIVINKQAGLTVHPGGGNYTDTLVNALLYHRKNELSGIGGVLRPGIVHRLDKDTSGLMVVAKNDMAHNSLANQLITRELKRTYYAFIWGEVLPKNGSISGYMAKSKINHLKMTMVNDEKDGKFSLTNYETLETFKNSISLIKCKLDTGRTHQIRVHFAYKKHPLIGDQLYGGNSRKLKGEETEDKKYINTFPRQALHSKEIDFIQPTTKQHLHFEVELPNDLKNLYEKVKRI